MLSELKEKNEMLELHISACKDDFAKVAETESLHHQALRELERNLAESERKYLSLTEKVLHDKVLSSYCHEADFPSRYSGTPIKLVILLVLVTISANRTCLRLVERRATSCENISSNKIYNAFICFFLLIDLSALLSQIHCINITTTSGGCRQCYTTE